MQIVKLMIFARSLLNCKKQIDDVLKQRDSFIKAHHIATNDVLNLKAERDALQKQIDLIVDLVRNQTIDYFLDNLIQDILKGDKND